MADKGQVAVDRTAPNGRVIGIDIIPAKPPKGATAIQGNFLSPSVQAEVKHMLRDPDRGRPRPQRFFIDDGDELDSLTEEGLEETERSYIDLERHATAEEYRENNSIITIATQGIIDDGNINQQPSSREEEKPKKKDTDKTVDVVLSDMSAPWEQTTGFHKRSLSEPYFRMMNTSGIPFRDHAGSMVCPNLSFIHQPIFIRSIQKNKKRPKLDISKREKLSCSNQNGIDLNMIRIYVMPPWNSVSIPCGSEVISSVNSIKASKINPWRPGFVACSRRFIERNRRLLAGLVLPSFLSFLSFFLSHPSPLSTILGKGEGGTIGSGDSGYTPVLLQSLNGSKREKEGNQPRLTFFYRAMHSVGDSCQEKLISSP